MDNEARALLRSLLTAQRVLSLAVVADGAPVVGLLPFVATPDFGALLVQASRLARHSRGLGDGAAFSALIHAPDAEDTDPLQVPRVTLEGKVEAIPAEGPTREDARVNYLARFPTAVVTMGLGDFTFYRLRIESGRLVAGFGRAFNLQASTLKDLAGGNP